MKRIMKIMKSLYWTICLCLMFGMVSMAAQPKLVSGTIKLVKDATTWLTAIAAVTTTAVALFHGIKWQFAGDEEKPKFAKAVRNTVMIGVVITCLAGIITLVLGYYK